MANNPFAGWMDEGQGQQQKLDPDHWSYYRWAGFSEGAARQAKARQEPIMVSYDELRDLSNLNNRTRSTDATPQSASIENESVDARTNIRREKTPGEKLASMIGSAYQTITDYQPLNPAKIIDFVARPMTNLPTRNFISDFMRSAATATPQTIADISGVIADAVTGNWGKGQSYTIGANEASKYNAPGGVAQTIGSFVPDVALGMGAFKAAASSLGKMAARSTAAAAAGEAGAGASGLAGRIGAWAAAGAEPTALKLGGRFISPAATRAERAAATLAAALPAAVNVAPEVAAGRMNAAEGALTVGLSAAAGPLSAGQWGGRVLTNIAGDVAVNLGAQGLTELVPAIIPGGAQFDAAQVWKNMTYGAAMGAMFGVMNARPIQGAGERSTLGARVPAAAEPTVAAPGAGTVAGGVRSPLVDIARSTEQELFGNVTLPENATPEMAAARLAEMRRMGAADIPTITRDEAGNVASLADQYRAQAPDSPAVRNAIDVERQAYANALSAKYADNPEALAAILELEVQPGEITPENAQQVLAQKIMNEWLIQPAEGKGIAGVEQRLGMAGAEGVVAAPAQEAAPVPPQADQLQLPPGPAAAIPAMLPEPSQVAPEVAQSVAMRSAQFNEPTPRLAGYELPPEQAASLAFRTSPETSPALQLIRDAENNVAAYKRVAEEVGVPVEDIIPDNSIEARLYEAEQAGVPNEVAQADIVNELLTEPEAFDLAPGQKTLIEQQLTSTEGQTYEPGRTGQPVQIQTGPEGMGLQSRAIEIPRDQIRTNAKPSDEVRAAIRQYNEANGFEPPIENHYVRVNEPRAQSIAEAYEALPVFDQSPESIEAYSALSDEIQKQWDFAINDMGMTFEPWVQEGQPYANSREMTADVRDNKHLYFFTGGEPHPLLGQPDESGLTMNDKLRAIHDLFGHAGEDYQFGPRGEENAWIKHSQMFSPLAQKALTTETRGQNSWVNYGAHNYDPAGSYKNIPAAERPFAVQKVALLPEEFLDWKGALAESGIALEQPIREAVAPVTEETRGGYKIRKRRASGTPDGDRQNTALDIIEGNTGSDVTTVEDKGATARPDSGPSADSINRVSKAVADIAREATDKRINFTSRENKKGSEGKQSKRTAEKNIEQLRKIFDDESEGALVYIKGPKQGGAVSLVERTLAEVSGMSQKEFQIAVAAGQSKFTDGMLTVVPSGEPGWYNVNTTISKAVRNKIKASFDAGSKAEVDSKVRASSTISAREKRIQEMNARYADVFDDFMEETVGKLEEANARMGITAPEDIAFENYSEAFAGLEEGASLAEGGYRIAESKANDRTLSEWRDRFIPYTRKAAKFFQEYLSAEGLTRGQRVNPKDIEFYIVSKLGPGKFMEPAQMYVDNTMNPSVRDILDRSYEDMLSSGNSDTHPVMQLEKLNTSLNESFFDDRYSTLLTRFNTAMNAADELSGKLQGVEAKDIVRLARWDNPTKTVSKKSVQEEATSIGEVFDQTKSDFIRSKINNLVSTDPAAYTAYETIVEYAKKRSGAEAFTYILNENLMGRGAYYKLNLRQLATLPVVRAAGVTTAMFALDEAVDQIEDNETYAGIPGSTLKSLLGSGEAGTYALAYGGFVSGLRVNQKVGARQGMRARTGNALRKLVDKVGMQLPALQNVSVARMDPQQKSKVADLYMAQKYPSVKPGTADYETLKANKIAADEYADLKGGRVAQVFDRIRKDKAAGVMSSVSTLVSDIKLVGARSQFIQDMIVMPYARAQMQARRILKSIEDPVNNVIGSLIQKYKKDRTFWDAIWALDYNMSALELANESVSREVLAGMRESVLEQVKTNFFTKADGNVSQDKWNDFMQFQSSLDSVRKEHLRTLLGKSLGVTSWDIESHYAELVTANDRLNEAIGASTAGLDHVTAQIDDLQAQQRAIIDALGAERAATMTTGFAEQLEKLQGAARVHRSNLRKFAREQQGVKKGIERIDQLDDMIEKSISNRYMFRLRDNTAPLVVRVQFDPASGVPSIRREYDSLADAKAGQIDIIRDAVAKMQLPEYQKYIEQKTKITDRIAELDALDELTPVQEAEIAKLNNELDSLQGFKPASEMSDAELFRFANDYEQLGMDATIRDMRKRNTLRAGSRAARKVLDLVMSSAQPIQAQLLTRAVDSGALTRAGMKGPEYVAGKGNATIMDFGSTSQVIVRQGDDAPSIKDLVDEIDDMIDEPIDRTQLAELLEKHYTYRDSSVNAQGKSVQTVWIDMGAMRRLIDAYTEPYIPNLIKRHNWTGYYDPDGKWTPQQRVEYTVKSIEGMLSQVQNYNSQTAMRNAIEETNNWLDKYDINNGLREYVAGLQMYNDRAMKGGAWDRLHQYEMSIRRGISFGTLALNLGSSIGNRIQGTAMAFAHGMQNATTKYGIYETKADGTRGPVQWMPSEASARAELYKMQQAGNSRWNITEGFASAALFDPRSYGLGVAAAFAPKQTLEFLAKRDGYGTLPESQQGQWARIYRSSQAANLQQGGVVGSYTVKQGVKTGTKGEKLLKFAGGLTDWVEAQNNYSSILMSGLDIENRFGLTDADWVTMNSEQKSDAVLQALLPHSKRLAEGSRARQVMDQDIQKIEAQIAEIEGTSGREAERIMLEKKLQSKKERAARLTTEQSALMDTLGEYLAFNRGFEQGDWDKISKSQLERLIESVPLGSLALTMTAPILRSYNSWMAMARRAGATEGGLRSKAGRMVSAAMGSAILTALLGGSANSLSAFGIFLSDISTLGEMLYSYMSEEDGEKLDKVSSRQAWEDMAATMGEKYGIDPKDARAFVRAAWPLGQSSEGLIKQAFDVNVNAGMGVWDVTGGGMPAQVILSTGKSMVAASKNIWEKSGSSGTWYDIMFGISSATPTSIKRVSQTALQALTPASAGGFGLVKVDKFGQPIYDKNNELQYMDAVDVARNTLFGKKWSETRSKLTIYEGGTPLYTEDDRIAWANTLRATKYVNFGESSKAAMRGAGVAEAQQMGKFERDAEALQRAITRRYREYRPQVDAAKNAINEMYKVNAPIDIGGGQTMPFRKILSIVATSGGKAEQEIKGSAPDEVRKSMLSLAEDWGRSRAAAEAVQLYYRSGIEVAPSPELYKSPTGDVFALTKLGQRFATAYRDWYFRQKGRQ